MAVKLTKPEMVHVYETDYFGADEEDLVRVHFRPMTGLESSNFNGKIQDATKITYKNTARIRGRNIAPDIRMDYEKRYGVLLESFKEHVVGIEGIDPSEIVSNFKGKLGALIKDSKILESIADNLPSEFISEVVDAIQNNANLPLVKESDSNSTDSSSHG